MIIGECPNCKECNMNELEHYGVWYKIKCQKCRKLHWLYNSRITPKRLSLKEFKKLYYVDKDGLICERYSNKYEEVVDELVDKYISEMADIICKLMINDIIHEAFMNSTRRKK